MPEPVRGDQRYVAGLDGLRALAVLAVIAYHLDLGWARGGMLGVGVFFTLSGYLITDLLLHAWRRTGSLGLRDFWLRRARRLLPILVVMLVVVSVLVAVFDAAQLGPFRTQVAAAALYVSNWWTIAHHGSYFSRFAAPLPLDHLWSLAIEEQFYLVWPWLLLLGLKAIPGGPRRLAGPIALAALASALAMALLYHPGYDPTRAYEGTDTRAFGLLIGAALAVVWPVGRLRPTVPVGARRFMDLVGAAGLAGILLLVWLAGPYSTFLYPGGMLLLSVATAAVVAVVVHPATRVGRALGWRPLRWIGIRSYGVYLWHWPIIVLTTPANGAASWPLRGFQVSATFGAAALSWRYIEDPIRHGALGRLWRQVRSAGGALAEPRTRIAAAVSGTAVIAVVTVGLAGLLPPASNGLAAANASTLAPVSSEGATISAERSAAHIRPAGPTSTSCSEVAYLGDSTSEGEVSAKFIPARGRRLAAQLADVGVRRTYLEISGGRSIVETLPGDQNAVTVASRLIADGFQGCWILALGTDDTADVAVGSPVGRVARIQRMMTITQGQPVLWVGAVSLRRSGPYSAATMRRWNQTLLQACSDYPVMRVFDWASVAQTRWFTSDGVHYTSAGSVARARLISRALATAFPADAPPPGGCLIR